MELQESHLGQRLRARRLAAGQTLEQVAASLAHLVTPQAISLYEKGRRRPRSSVLAALAHLYDTTVEHLDAEPIGGMGTVELSFRHPGTLAAGLREEARGRLSLAAERSFLLEQLVGVPMPPVTLPAAAFNDGIATAESMESMAETVRNAWKLGSQPLGTLVSILEANGIRVFSVPFSNRNYHFSGCSAYASNGLLSNVGDPVILINSVHWAERQRFTLAHELAHLLLLRNEARGQTEGHEERLANWFAGAFLMPGTSIREFFGSKRRTLTWTELLEAKRRFRVSFQALTYRCRVLGIISEQQFSTLFEKYRQLGWRSPPYEETGALHPESELSERVTRLAYRGITEKIFGVKDASTLIGMPAKDLKLNLARL